MRGRRLIAVGLVVAAGAAGWLVHHRSGPAGRQARAEEQLRAVLPTLDLRDASLAKAVEALRQLSGADIILDPAATDGAELVTLKLKDVTLDRALEVLAGYIRGPELIYTIHDGRIVITLSESAGQYSYVRVYDIRDIDERLPPGALVYAMSSDTGGGDPDGAGLFGPVSQIESIPPEEGEEIARLITETVSPDRWTEAGGNGAVRFLADGRIVVVAAWEDHRRIQDLLSQLREPAKE